MNIRFDVTEEKNIGRRFTNEDYVSHRIEKTWGLFVVADGLGGHAIGEVASKLFVEEMLKLAPFHIDTLLHAPIESMQNLIASSHQSFRKKIIKDYDAQDARTTLAAAWIYEKGWISAHIGDSRIYRINSSKTEWQSHDHSLVQQMVDQGEISATDMGQHPYQHVILRTIDIYGQPQPEIIFHPALNSSEAVLLCTDGFWENIPDKSLCTLLKANDLSMALHGLVLEALEHGGKSCDNVTAQLVSVHQT